MTPTADTPASLLRRWIARQAAPEAMSGFEAKCAEAVRDGSARGLMIAFSQVGRRLGKAILVLDAEDLARAEASRPGWRPSGLTLEQAGRILLLIEAGAAMADFPAALKSIASVADLGELVALLRGLPLYPHPEALTAIAAEGVRSSMRPVFEAVAHDNPYPAEQFAEAAWNQMVVKTLFIDSVIHPIIGLDNRWNPDLAATLVDYAHERWAAGRTISPELWRGVGRFADASAVKDLARVLAEGDAVSRRAAVLALGECPHPDAAAALAAAPDLAEAAAKGDIGWNDVRAPAAHA